MADISLIFDVAMDGHGGDDSRKIIETQIRDIVNNLNGGKPYEIKFVANQKSLNDLRKSIENILGQIGIGALNFKQGIPGTSSAGGVNINLGLNSNAFERNRAYGLAARDTLIELQKRAELTEQAIAKAMNMSNGLDATVQAIANAYRGDMKMMRYLFDDMIPRVYGDTATKAPINNQMSSWLEYISLMEKAASINKIDLSDVNSQFDKSAKEAVASTRTLLSAENEAEKQAERLRSIFGQGMNAEELREKFSGLTETIVGVTNAINGLSETSNTSLQRLLDAIDRVIESFGQMKGMVLGGSSDDPNSTNGSKKLEKDTTEYFNAMNQVKGLQEALKDGAERFRDASVSGMSDVRDAYERYNKLIAKAVELENDLNKSDPLTNSDFRNRLASIKAIAKESEEIMLSGGNVNQIQLTNGTDKYKKSLHEANVLLTEIINNSKIWQESSEINKSVDFTKYIDQIQKVKLLIQDLQSEKITLEDFTNRMNEITTATNEVYDVLGRPGIADSFELKKAKDIVSGYYRSLREVARAKGEIKPNSNGVYETESNALQGLTGTINKATTAYNGLRDSIKRGVSNLSPTEIFELQKFDTSEMEKYETTATRMADAAWDAERRKREASEMSAEAITSNLLKIEAVQNRINDASNLMMKYDVSDDARNNLLDVNADLNNLRMSLEAARDQTTSVIPTNQAFSESFSVVKRSIDMAIDAINREVDASKAMLKPGTADYGTAQKSLSTEMNRAYDILQKYSAAEYSSSKSSRIAYENVKNAASAYEDLYNRIRSGLVAKEEFYRILKTNAGVVASSSAEIKKMGDNHTTLGGKVKNLAKNFSYLFNSTRLVFALYRQIRNMIQAAIELESSFAQLKIVTGVTNAELEAFSKTAFELSNALGQDVAGVTKSIEVFSRLGYSLEEATELTKYANILANVASVSTEDATKGLTSIIKGFGFQVSDAEHISDVLVKVGQKYAVSASELMEAYEKSGAALNATHTSFEKSAALIAAANASVQNAGTVGTALKTVSARIRVSKSDLESLGEDTSDLADSFSKYAKEIKALTGFNILKDGSTTQYKDIYEIFDGLADALDKISDKETTVARVAEILGGTRQNQVIFSILTNWKDASAAYADAMHAVGEATRANDIYMETAAAKINQFKSAFKELSYTLMSDGIITDVVQFGIAIVNALKGISNLINALGGLKAAIIGVAGSIAFIKAGTIVTKISKVLDSLRLTKTALLALKVAIPAATREFVKFGTQEGLVVAGTTRFSHALDILKVNLGGAKVQAAAAAIGLRAFVVAATLVVMAVSKIKQSIEEAKQRSDEALKSSYDNAMARVEESKSLYDLFAAYNDAKKKIDDSIESKDALTRATNDLAKALGFEKEAIDGVNGSLQKATEEELLEAKRSADDAVISARTQLHEMFTTTSNKDFWKLPSQSIFKLASNVVGGPRLWESESYGFRSSDEEILDFYDRLVEKKNDLIESGVKQGKRPWFLQQDTLLDEQAYQVVTVAIDTLKDYVDRYRSAVSNASEAEERYNDVVDGTAGAVEKAADNVEEFNGLFMNPKTKESIEETTTAISALTSAYDLLSKAERESKDGGMTPETISSLAKDTEKYLEFLEVENGIVKLNADAYAQYNEEKYKEQASTAQDNLDGLYKGRESLNTLRDLVEQYNELAGSPENWYQNGGFRFTDTGKGKELNKQVDSLEKQILELSKAAGISADTFDKDFTEAVENNSKAIEETKKELEIYNLILDATRKKAESLYTKEQGEISSFQKAKSGMDILDKIYADVKNGGAFDFASLIDDNFVLKFGELGDAYNEFIATIMNSPGDIAACQSAFDNLTGAFLRQTGVLDGVTEENRNVRISLLEAMGVANASAVVDSELAYQKKKLQYETEGLSDKTYEEIIQMYNAADASYTEKRALAALLKEKLRVSQADIQSSSDIEYLLRVATAANAAASSTKKLIRARELYAEAESLVNKIENEEYTGDYGLGQLKRLIRQKQEEAEKLAKEPIEFDIIDTSDIDIKYGGKEETKKDSKRVEEYKAEIDEYYKAQKKLESIRLHVEKLEDEFEKSDDEEERLRIKRELISSYTEEAGAVLELNELRRQGIEKNLEQLRQDGIEAEYNAETNELIIKNKEKINELTKKAEGSYENDQEAINEYRKQVEKLVKETEDLNKENQEGISTYENLQKQIADSKVDIVDVIDSIAEKARDLSSAFEDVYGKLTSAAKDYAETGFLSFETLRDILEMEPKYLKYLRDENNQLIVNEESLINASKARMKDAAAESAWAYASKILEATKNDEKKTIKELAAWKEADADATWDAAYAAIYTAKTLGTLNGIEDSYYDDAISNITKMRNLTNMAIDTSSEYYASMKDGYISQKDAIDQLIEMTQDLIKWENEQQVDALEKQKEKYAEIVEQKKKALEIAKKQDEREKSVGDKLKNIAKLQSRIMQLSLDDSREAKAQRVKLEEELAEAQSELADEQSQYAYDTQVDALDKQQEAYEKSKDEEIKTLENTLSSTEKLYQAAVDRITQAWNNDWNGFYGDLKKWNLEYGSTLEKDLVNSWETVTRAAENYGSAVAAIMSVGGRTEADVISDMKANSTRWFTAVNDRDAVKDKQANLAAEYERITGRKLDNVDGAWYDNGKQIYSLDQKAVAESAVAQMDANAKAWKNAVGNPKLQNYYEQQNEKIAKDLEYYLGKKIEKEFGTWYIYDGGKKDELFRHKFHTGGIVGETSKLRENEVMAVLEKGETVLTRKTTGELYRLVDFVSVLSDRIGKELNADNIAAAFGMSSMAAYSSPLGEAFRRGVSSLVKGMVGGESDIHVDTVQVNAPIQVLQKLDREELRRCSEEIGAISATYIKNGFTKRGIKQTVSLA